MKVYLYLEKYDELIVDTLKESNEQIVSYTNVNDIIILKEEVFEEFDYSEIKDLLETDFNQKITIVIGGIESIVLNHISNLPSDVYYFDDLIVYLVNINKGVELKKWLNNFDVELVNTITKYIEFDMSINKTANELYIHRNTLNYRLDKFYNLTGLNVRTFKGSLAVYLILNFVQTTN